MRRNFIRISSFYSNFIKMLFNAPRFVRSATYFSDTHCLLFHSTLSHKTCKICNNYNNDRCNCFRHTGLKKWVICVVVAEHRGSKRIDGSMKNVSTYIIFWWIERSLQWNLISIASIWWNTSAPYIHATLCQHAAYLRSHVNLLIFFIKCNIIMLTCNTIEVAFKQNYLACWHNDIACQHHYVACIHR